VAVDPGVAERVRRVFREALTTEVSSDEADLIESGLLDSLALVELLFAIEREFSVSFALEEFEIESFRTVRTISEAIAGLNGVPQD
jgi:acyl carrier protein